MHDMRRDEYNRNLSKMKNDLIRRMKDVGTYHASHTHAVMALARILLDYQMALEQFDEDGSQILIWHTNRAGERNQIKNPLYLAIEKMRDDILAYSRELGITPTGLKRIKSDTQEQPKSKLLDALNAYAGKK